MSVVANVAINVDSSGAVSKLRQVQQGAQATSQAVDKLNATTAATSDKFKIAANGIKYFTDAAGRARAENGRFLTTAERAAAGIEAQGNAAQRASGKFKGLGNALASLGAGLALRKAFGDASELESAQSRIGLVAKNFQQLAGIQDVAANAAKKFNLSQAESLNALTDLGNRIGPTGASLQDVANVYDGFNTLLALNKVNSQNAASATLQLNQALGSGRLAGEEFNAISEATPQLLDAVAVVMGRNRSELKKLASDGKINSEVLIQALTLIKTKGAADLETAFSGAFGATRQFDAAISDFSATVGSELLPVITPVINFATQILKLFGQLPGPVKAVAAAILGLAAAFVVLAPAITAAIGLLGGLSLATLAAAGPWIALAAGITAAVVALASYRSESEKIGAKAAAGDPAALAAARNRMVDKQQEVALLKAQRPSPRSAKGGDLARAQNELAQLKRDVATGETAAVGAAATGNAINTPIGATVGDTTATGPTGGKAKAASDEAANAAKRIAEQIRASQVQLTLAQDIFAIEGRLQEAQLAGNDQLVLARNAQKELAQIASQRADIVANKEMPALEKKNVLNKLAIDAATVSGKLGFDLAGLEQQRVKDHQGILQNARLELALAKEKDPLKRAEMQIEAQLVSEQFKKLNLTEEQINQIRQLLFETEKLKNATVENNQLFTDMASATAGAFGSAIDSMLDGTESLGVSLRKIGADLLKTIAKMLIMQAIAEALGALGGTDGKGVFSFLAKAFGKNANGNAYGANGIIPFAKGGIVNSPTLFPFAKGVGLMGEAGPEAIMPLQRGADGKLGVLASGGASAGGVNVVVNVDASGSKVEGDEQEGKQLGRLIAAAIQQELVKQKRPGGLLA